jgi:hypothetical protein
MENKTQSPKQSKQSLEDSSPEDIQACWLKVARRAQAACYNNGGFGLLTLTVAVNGNKAILWMPPEMTKVEPAKLAKEMEMSAETFISLAALVSENGNGS